MAKNVDFHRGYAVAYGFREGCACPARGTRVWRRMAPVGPAGLGSVWNPPDPGSRATVPEPESGRATLADDPRLEQLRERKAQALLGGGPPGRRGAEGKAPRRVVAEEREESGCEVEAFAGRRGKGVPLGPSAKRKDKGWTAAATLRGCYECPWRSTPGPLCKSPLD